MSLIEEKRDSKGKKESDKEENDSKALQIMGKAALGSFFFSFFIFIIGICIVTVASNLDNINRLIPKSTPKKTDKKSKRKCGYEDDTYTTRKGFPKTRCEEKAEPSVTQQGGSKKFGGDKFASEAFLAASYRASGSLFSFVQVGGVRDWAY